MQRCQSGMLPADHCGLLYRKSKPVTIASHRETGARSHSVTKGSGTSRRRARWRGAARCGAVSRLIARTPRFRASSDDTPPCTQPSHARTYDVINPHTATHSVSLLRLLLYVQLACLWTYYWPSVSICLSVSPRQVLESRNLVAIFQWQYTSMVRGWKKRR